MCTNICLWIINYNIGQIWSFKNRRKKRLHLGSLWLPLDWLFLGRSKLGLICDPLLWSDCSGSALWDASWPKQSCRGVLIPGFFRVSDPSLWLDEKTMTDPRCAACMKGWTVFLPSFSVWQWFESEFSLIIDCASVCMERSYVRLIIGHQEIDQWCIN